MVTADFWPPKLKENMCLLSKACLFVVSYCSSLGGNASCDRFPSVQNRAVCTKVKSPVMHTWGYLQRMQTLCLNVIERLIAIFIISLNQRQREMGAGDNWLDIAFQLNPSLRFLNITRWKQVIRSLLEVPLAQGKEVGGWPPTKPLRCVACLRN